MRILSFFFLLCASNVFSQNHIDTKSYGQRILIGTFRPSDDTITFQVLDSLFCKTTVDKDFYFDVANKIQTLSDGALGEYFSGIASRYYLEYNSEFITHSKELSQKDIEGWLSQVGYDIAATEQRVDSLPKIKIRLDNLEKQCNCSFEDKALIKKYNKVVFEIIDSGIRNP